MSKRESGESYAEGPSEILQRWETNGVDGSLGLVGTSVWRLEPIIRNGIKSIQSINRFDYLPPTYVGNNFTFMAQYPGIDGIETDIDKYDCFEEADCYARINSELDYLAQILASKGQSAEQARQFIIDEPIDVGVFTHYTLSKRSLRRIARRVSKKVPFTNQDVRYLNRNVRKLTGVVLGYDPFILHTHTIVDGLDNPGFEAIIDLGSRDNIPPSFIQGIYIPPNISDFEREELHRIRMLAE